jgi:hypothetical protein
MKRSRRFSVTPGAALGLIAMFFALGGSALAVGDAIQGISVAQQRCTNGAVRGIAVVTGNPSQGIANIPDQFSSSASLFSRRFNCARGAVQVRRLEIGVYEVRFPGNSAPSAFVGGVGLFTGTSETIAPGTFRVRVQNVGRADEADGPFMLVAI